VAIVSTRPTSTTMARWRSPTRSSSWRGSSSAVRRPPLPILSARWTRSAMAWTHARPHHAV